MHPSIVEDNISANIHLLLLFLLTLIYCCYLLRCEHAVQVHLRGSKTDQRLTPRITTCFALLSVLRSIFCFLNILKGFGAFACSYERLYLASMARTDKRRAPSITTCSAILCIFRSFRSSLRFQRIWGQFSCIVLNGSKFIGINYFVLLISFRLFPYLSVLF